MKVNTEKQSGGRRVSPVIEVGTQIVYLDRLELVEKNHPNIPKGAVEVIMHARGPEIDGFEGFFKDKNNESKGKHSCQIGRIKADQYFFADSDKVKITRDQQISNFIQDIGFATGTIDFFAAVDPDDALSIPSFFERINVPGAPWIGKPIRMTIGADEYFGKDKKTGETKKFANQTLFLVKKDWKNDVPAMENGDIPLEESTVIAFDPDIHVIKAKKPADSNFQGNAGDQQQGDTTNHGNMTEEEQQAVADLPF